MAVDTKSSQITDHVDEVKAGNILQDFYRAYRNRNYGLFEMLAFAYEKGMEDQLNESGKERNSGSYLDSAADNKQNP